MKTIIEPYYLRIGGKQGNNLFKRKEFQKKLSSLFKNTDESLVVSLDAKWGEGKTSFIKIWENELSAPESQLIPIYYDAFKNDFTNDAFISIAVTIQKQIEVYYGRIGKSKLQEEKVKAYKESAKYLGNELIKMAGTQSIKYLSLGLIDTSNIWGHALSKAIKFDERKNIELLDEQYDAFLKSQKMFENYRSELKKLLSLDRNNPRRIIFFIDELDRCRPSFAIEVIEKIKHLFSIEGVHFLLAINKDQLMKIIDKVYGVGESGSSIYLQKFVHLEVKLPSLTERKKSNSPFDFEALLKELKDSYEFTNESFDEVEAGILFSQFHQSSSKGIVLRSIERVLTLYSVIIKITSAEFTERNWRKILFSCLLKVEAEEVYNSVRMNKTISTRHWDRNTVDYSLGSFPKQLESFFKEDEYKPKASRIDQTYDLLQFEEVFEYVDMFDIPKAKIKTDETIKPK